MTSRQAQMLLLALLCSALAGCSVWRGMPTHGGGKRFDEEQRIVAGSIRRAAADMSLEELRGRNVQLIIDGLAHNGGGYVTMPGLQNISGNFGKSIGTQLFNYEPMQLPPPGYYSSQQDSKSYNNSQSYGVSGSYQPTMTYSSAQFGSDADMNYLTAAIAMKARHSGLNVVTANPEILLYVLVDVLGINRSRRDNVFLWNDKLTASCELTYYAVEAPSNHMLFRARQAKAEGKYAEDSMLLFTAFNITRELRSAAPDFLPVDASLSTQTLAELRHTTATTLANSQASALPPELANVAARRDPARLEFAAARLRDADAQLRNGNLELASRNLDAVQAMAPDFPGLVDLLARLAEARQTRERIRRQYANESEAQAAANAAREQGQAPAAEVKLSAGRLDP